MMRNTLFLIASFASAGFSSSPVYAQWSNYGDDDDIIRCESRDGRTERCATYGGDAQLVRQLSGNPCVRGRTWGTDSRGVWVSSGCRGEFRVDTGYGYDNDDDNGYGNNGYGYGNNDGAFRCESREGRTQRCNGYGGRAQFVRQLSNTPCIRGQSWGSDSRGVWVSNGCRALFSSDNRYGNGGYGNHYGNNYGNNYGHHGNDLVRCESRDNRSHSCALSVSRGGTIRLLRQLSGKPCIENQTWGRSRNGVWVTQGCRAEFVVGRGGNSGNYQRPPGDLGRVPGGKYPDVFQNVSSVRAPGDLGDAVPSNARVRVDERQPPPAEGPAERPSTFDLANRTRIRPVEEAPGRLEEPPVEESPARSIVARPLEDAGPGQRQPRDTSGAAEPEVSVAAQPAPRERGMEQVEPR